MKAKINIKSIKIIVNTDLQISVVWKKTKMSIKIQTLSPTKLQNNALMLLLDQLSLNRNKRGQMKWYGDISIRTLLSWHSWDLPFKVILWKIRNQPGVLSSKSDLLLSVGACQ